MTEVTKVRGDDPAFPVSVPGCGDNGWHGMSLRDYFAAQFLPAAMSEAASASKFDLDDLFGEDRINIRREEIAARIAYRMADAMIAAR
jgi:hypothetical protein